MAIPNSILISDHRYGLQPVIRMPQDIGSMQSKLRCRLFD
jgi:hypothetical protein